MMRGLIGRGLIVIASALSLLAPSTPVFGFIVAGVLAVAFLLVASCQKAIWMDGWWAAHEHHGVDEPDTHLSDYEQFLSRQGWH